MSSENISDFIQAFQAELDNLCLEIEKFDYVQAEIDARVIGIQQRYSSTLGFSLNDVKKWFQERATPKVDVKEAYTLEEILKYKNTDLTGDIVPRVFTTGVNLLSAYAKTGKSRIIYFLLHSLIVSKEFLGFPTRRVGTILYYQLEESTKLIQKRLRASDFDNEDNPDILRAIETNQIIFLRMLRISDGLRKLEKDVKKYGKVNPVSLVIIDTLRKSMRGGTSNENSAEWAGPVGDLQSYSLVQNLSIIILHHHNKEGTASGTSALDGEANQIINVYKNYNEKEKKLKSPKHPPNALIIKTTPRDGLPASFVVQSKQYGSKQCLELLEEEGVSAEILSLEIKVVNLLKQDEYREKVCRGLTVEEIAEKLEYKDVETLSLALERLMESSFMDSNRSKGIDYYYIPDYIYELYGNLGILGKAKQLNLRLQDISVQVQEATTKEEIEAVFKGMSEVDRHTVYKLMPQEERIRASNLINNKPS